MLSTIYYKVIRKLLTVKEEQNSYSGGYFPRLVRTYAAMIVKNFQGRIVELGCGEGLFLEKIAINNPEAKIYGVDQWKEILIDAKKRLEKFNNILLINADAKDTKLQENFFDYCFCLNTIYNFCSKIEIKNLLIETRRILKRGGMFVFDIRNSANPLIQLKYKLIKLYEPKILTPVRAYGINFIERILTETGFKLVKKIFIGIPKNKYSPVVLFIAVKE